MAKSEIVNWAASAGAIDDDNDNESTEFWRKERVLSSWSDALDYAQKKLMTGSTKIRREFLQHQLLPLVKQRDLSTSQNLDLFQLFTQGYSRYTDTGSRNALETVVIEMVRQDQEAKDTAAVTDKIFAWLANESVRISKQSSSGSFAPTDILVLLTWCCGCYNACLNSGADFTETRLWPALVCTMAALLDSVLHRSARTKPSLQRSALVRTRRTLRSVPTKLPILIDTLTSQAKSSSTPLVYAPLIGISIDVTIRLKNVQDQTLTHVSPESKGSVLSFYATSLLMSKVPVSPHESAALHDFIQSFISEEDFSSLVLPTIEKALLRSPEISLIVVRDFFRRIFSCHVL